MSDESRDIVIAPSVAASHGDPLVITVNGVERGLPVGKAITVAADVAQVLADIFIPFSDETAVPRDQPPAEAASGGSGGGDLSAPAVDFDPLTVIHQSIARLRDALPSLTAAQLDALHAAEVAEGEGKTRKGALEAIAEAKAALSTPEQ